MNIPRSAKVLASRRTIDASLPNSLLNDTYSKIFVDEEMLSFAQKTNSTVHYVLMRHKVLEDYTIGTEHFEQILLLGAGLDTKFLRYPAKANKILEVDSDDLISFKQNILTDNDLTHPKSHSIKVQFLDDIKRVINSLDKRKPTAIVAEGFFMYFEKPFVFQAIQHLTEYFNSYFLGFDLLDPTYIESEENRKIHERLKASGEKSLSFISARELDDAFVKEGIHSKVWYPSSLQKRYYGTNWEGRDDKFVFAMSNSADMVNTV